MLLKVLTWNVEGNGLSAAAPWRFKTSHKQQAILRHICHDAPHILALQEVFDLPTWKVALAQHGYSTKAVGPSICAEVQIQGATKPLLIAGCHLAPFKQGVAERLQQLQKILQTAEAWTPHHSQQPASVAVHVLDASLTSQQLERTSEASGCTSSDADIAQSSSSSSNTERHERRVMPLAEATTAAMANLGGAEQADGQQQTSSVPASGNQGPLAVLILGDMNICMREAETSAVTGLGLTDAYLAAVGSGTARPDTKYTWDSRRNRYYKDGFAFACRLDIVFYKGAVWRGVQSFQLVGHTPEEGVEGFYLSDHFGIMTTLDIE